MGSDVKVMRPYDFIDHDEECPTCSAKKCDNLLVETDIVFHFRGLILCNAKRLQFHRYKKKNIGEKFSKSSIPLCLLFFKLMELLLPFALHKNFLIATAPLSFLMVSG